MISSMRHTTHVISQDRIIQCVTHRHSTITSTTYTHRSQTSNVLQVLFIWVIAADIQCRDIKSHLKSHRYLVTETTVKHITVYKRGNRIFTSRRGQIPKLSKNMHMTLIRNWLHSFEMVPDDIKRFSIARSIRPIRS